MTTRTDTNPATAIEIATENVVHSIRHAATLYYAENQVARHHATTEPQFLRVLALYFADKSIADWCRDLGIPDATESTRGNRI